MLACESVREEGVMVGCGIVGKDGLCTFYIHTQLCVHTS